MVSLWGKIRHCFYLRVIIGKIKETFNGGIIIYALSHLSLLTTWRRRKSSYYLHFVKYTMRKVEMKGLPLQTMAPYLASGSCLTPILYFSTPLDSKCNFLWWRLKHTSFHPTPSLTCYLFLGLSAVPKAEDVFQSYQFQLLRDSHGKDWELYHCPFTNLFLPSFSRIFEE